jgi:UDP-N-acetylmuramate dehydrogenase
MQIKENLSLRPYNTFGIDAKARYFSTFTNADELYELTTRYRKLTTFILGGGSNILFIKDFDGFLRMKSGKLSLCMKIPNMFM